MSSIVSDRSQPGVTATAEPPRGASSYSCAVVIRCTAALTRSYQKPTWCR
ncbi:hypothetical protein [Rhodococcus sp. NPDC003348]